MRATLQLTLDFMHLENALFSAEQSITDGVDLLEIGPLLIKSTGLNGVRIFKDKFPNVPVVVDIKTIQNENGEIEAIADAGASGITISGAVSDTNWQKCLEKAHSRSLKVFFDIRGMCIPCLRSRIRLAEKADYIVLDFNENDPESSFNLLQEISFQISTPIVVHNIQEEQTIVKAISCGASSFGISVQETRSQNIKEIVAKFLNIITREAKSEIVTDPAKSRDDKKSYNEQVLKNRLSQLSPSNICEAYNKPAFLERIYPLHRFTKVLGKACTIKVWPGSQVAVLKFLLEVDPESILVIDGGGSGSAVWGAAATEIALKRKLAGVVVHGTVTEVNVVRSKSFPCYTNSISPVSETGNRECLKNIPVRIGDVTIHPGDWMIGDDSGIICIPSSEIFSILDNASKISLSRQKMIEEIESCSDSDQWKKILSKYYDI